MTDNVTWLRKPSPRETDFYEASEAVAAAEVRYSQAFQIAKSRGASDSLAREVAVEMTEAELTKLNAVRYIAQLRLEQ